jgi:hypothetical protein
MLAPTEKAADDDASIDLAFTLVSLLRADGYLCNVLTHVSSDDWRAVERAINAILEPRTPPRRLSNIPRNLLELLCDDRGIAGRIMRPFFFAAVAQVAGTAEMKRHEARIRRLRRRISCDPMACRAPRTPRPASRARIRPLPAFAPAPQQANGVSP